MSPELIAAICTGLVAVIGSVSAFTARRSQRQSDELRALREENARFRRQQRLTDQWAGRVVRAFDLRGIPIPAPPEGLFDDFPDIAAHPRSTPDDDPTGRPETA